ncbi:hypothetical protein NCC49_001784 [Naganishia albida]|nr:hypothetical protein NCC49_001784 [Naganishia albida]
MSADTGHVEPESNASLESRVGGKPGANLPRTKSSAGSSQLFRNRQVGFSRTNSSLLGAGANGVSIIMGKRKTMVVPVGRGPTERKVSGESASMGKPTDLAARRSTSGGNPSRHAAPQAPGPATLALVTPAKPRGNHFSHRPSIHHYPTEGTNNGYRQEMTRHSSSSTLLGRPGDFVAETPAMPGGRQQSRSAATFTRAPSLSTYPSGRFGGTAQNGFDAQAAGDDDLADFMVDTDEEDDGVLFSGGNRRRSSHATQGRPSVRQSVEDVPEVPETPMKAI